MAASGISSGRFDVGAYETEQIVLIEADARGQRRRAEFFADDRLSDAVARLYERHADLLPDGPARERAAATARSVATMMGPADLDRWATAFAPSIEWADHRTVGLGSVHGAEAVVRGIRALIELSEEFAARVDDILALRSNALLVRWTNFGTARASGGAFERPLLVLWVFGTDGLIARWEQLDPDRADEALARFDELTAEPGAAPRLAAGASRGAKKRARRVQPNAATANGARMEAGVAARDVDALRHAEHRRHRGHAPCHRHRVEPRWRARQLA